MGKRVDSEAAEDDCLSTDGVVILVGQSKVEVNWPKHAAKSEGNRDGISRQKGDDNDNVGKSLV